VKAYTLFTLKKTKRLENYVDWSLEQVRPRMLKMPSVLGFVDYQVIGAMNKPKASYTFVEEIMITNPKEFEHDNSVGDGVKLAEEWNEWVEDFEVIYCKDLKEIY